MGAAGFERQRLSARGVDPEGKRVGHRQLVVQFVGRRQGERARRDLIRGRRRTAGGQRKLAAAGHGDRICPLNLAQHSEPASFHMQATAQRLHTSHHRQRRRSVANRGTPEPLGVQVSFRLLPLGVGQHAVVQQDFTEAQAAEPTGAAAVTRDIGLHGIGRTRFDDEREQPVTAGETAPHTAHVLTIEIRPSLTHIKVSRCRMPNRRIRVTCP